MAVDVIKSNENNEKTALKTVEAKHSQNTNDLETQKDPTKLTPYERLQKELNEDEKCSKEIQLGKRIGFYKIRGELGSGNFAQVKLSYHCLTKEKVALKILDKTKLDEKTKRLLMREIQSMEQLNHPNIIRIFEVLETMTKIYIALEYACHGELFHKILNEGKFTEQTSRVYFGQLTSAVAYMHKNNIIHRDIKAENVFIALSGVCKIGDLGFSTIINKPEEKLNTFCGSPPYAAPELFKDDYYIGRYVDIWALGVLLYFMVTGAMPFRADTVGKLKRKILEGQFTIPDHVSETCQFLIKQILRLIPADRASMLEIMRSLWMEGADIPRPSKFLGIKPVSSDDVKTASLTDDEVQGLKQLTQFGITDEIIAKCANDTRDAVNGTYRIAIYQGHRKRLESQMEREAQVRRDLEELKRKRSNGKKKSNTSKGDDAQHSKFCTLV